MMKIAESLTDARHNDRALLRPVADLMQTQLLRCSEHERIAVALARMDQQAVGSILIDCDDGSTGILTRSDLIKRLILPKHDLDVAIAKVMTHPVHCLPLESSVLDAMHAMMFWRLRHLPIRSGALIVGLVSEHDLMRQQRNRPDRLMLSIDHADDESELIAAASQAAEVATQLKREGLGALHIARMMSLLNDALTRQAITLVLRADGESGDEGKDWAWLALGSEARAEQTIVTDQDNALIVRDEAMIPRWLKRARKINHLLDRMGFPLCQGAVMAMNEHWCKSLDRWLKEAQTWLTNPSPQAILNAQIVLDFRYIAGDRKLVESLETGLSALFSQTGSDQGLSMRGAARQAFLRQMLGDMLKRGIRPIPSDWQFRLQGLLRFTNPSQPWHLDIKLQGTALIVDAARFLVLSRLAPGQWMPHGTLERLQWLDRYNIIGSGESSALIDAFEALTDLRLGQQMLINGMPSPGQSTESKLYPEHPAVTGPARTLGPNQVDLRLLNTNQRWKMRHHMQSIADFREFLRLDFAA